jgi:PelA/Pel-15E family pectate lyase
MRRLLLLSVAISCFMQLVDNAYAVQSANWKDFAAKSWEWYRSDERNQVVDNILAWQTQAGGWPKNVDTTKTPANERGQELLDETFDNGATTFELRFLARCQRVKPDERIATAFNRGLDLVLKAQYENGGWPQYYPPRKNYTGQITLNDQLMVNLLGLLRDVSQPAKDFVWVDEARRQVAQEKLAKGIDLLLKLQVVIDSQKTIWAAQYDRDTLKPVAARKFEPVSLATAESAGVVRFLMTVDGRRDEIDPALTSAVAWFEANAISGYRYGDKGKPMLLYPDANGPLLWARFYDIQTGQAVFGRRDGVIVGTLEELDEERREGYAWYGDWGVGLKAKVEEWRAK